MTHSRHVRGQAFSRYGGLGNHRYPHGFSGDTFQHEVTLYWQVKTTQTAANEMWGYWSHDIGGFHTGQGAPDGCSDPTNTTGSELFLRWLQFGAVAPVLRTHCDHCERRIWKFPYFEQMRDAMVLRNALVPYIYTEARRFYDTGVAPLHPMYYEYPHDPRCKEPLVVDRQYFFGDRVLAMPVTTITGKVNGTVHDWEAYLPEGNWSDWTGTTVTVGPSTVTTNVTLAEIPLWVRGGVLPMKTMASVAGDYPSPLVWALWPGTAAGHYTLYEDDGDADNYIGGSFVTTTISFTGDVRTAHVVTVKVAAAEVSGSLPTGFPAIRSHVVQVRGVETAGRKIATVTCNGALVPPKKDVAVAVASAARMLGTAAAAPTASPGSWWEVTTKDGGLVQPKGCLLIDAGDAHSFDELVIVITFHSSNGKTPSNSSSSSSSSNTASTTTTVTTANAAGAHTDANAGPIVIATPTFSLTINQSTCLCTTTYYGSGGSKSNANIDGARVSTPVPFLSFYNRASDARDSNLDACTSVFKASDTVLRVVAPHGAGSIDLSFAAKGGSSISSAGGGGGGGDGNAANSSSSSGSSSPHPHVVFEVVSISGWSGADPIEKHVAFGEFWTGMVGNASTTPIVMGKLQGPYGTPGSQSTLAAGFMSLTNTTYYKYIFYAEAGQQLAFTVCPTLDVADTWIAVGEDAGVEQLDNPNRHKTWWWTPWTEASRKLHAARAKRMGIDILVNSWNWDTNYLTINETGPGTSE